MLAQPFDVLRYTFFNAGKRGVITGLTQFCEISLGKTLVFAPKRFGKRDVFNETLLEQFPQGLFRHPRQHAATVHVGRCEFVEALSTSRTKVEYPGFLRMIKEEQIDFGDVADIDEITFLVAFGITVAVRRS